MLNWVNRFNIFSFLDSQQYQLPHGKLEWILAAGAAEQVEAPAGNALTQLSGFLQGQEDWFFGHFSYDLKSEIAGHFPDRKDELGFSDLFFFRPEVIIENQADDIRVSVLSGDPAEIFQSICSQEAEASPVTESVPLIESRLTRDQYLEAVGRIQQHIRRGDCYELNFCQEFFAREAFVDPLKLYERLSAMSPNPFNAFYRVRESFLLCASPERFLQREGNLIRSQPIKGTMRRTPGAEEGDGRQIQAFLSDPKERSENVMVVDLVRNDLSRICREGSVFVEELCGLRQFPQVYHLVSTVCGLLRPGLTLGEIIRATFPMGSMTGAPKNRVLELIDRFEQSRRGLFSGALGYVAPGGDFDFNVVIRSMLYNRARHYLSFQTGSGITHYSRPDREYEECLLKAEAIKKVLAG